MPLPDELKWVVIDFEFVSAPEQWRLVLCMVALLSTGEMYRFDSQELKKHRDFPVKLDADTIIVGFNVTAEFGCMAALGWQIPANPVFDLFVECRAMRNTHNKRWAKGESSLNGFLVEYGLPVVKEKKETLQLILSGKTEFSATEWGQILDYCSNDVIATARLFKEVLDEIEI